MQTIIRLKSLANKMDSQTLRATLQSIRTAMEDYSRRETELRELARISNNAEVRNMYTREADEFRRMRIAELPQNLVNLRQTTEPARSQGRQRTQRQLAFSVPPASVIPQTRPINIPDTIPEEIPNEFLCPITTEIMKDPVMLTDGHVYEKQAIQKWLANNDTSPMTKVKVDKSMIIPCFVLRKLIQDFLENSSKTNVSKVSSNIPVNTETKIKQKRKPTKYNLYVKEQMPIVKQQHPGLSMPELIKIIGAQWKIQSQ